MKAEWIASVNESSLFTAFVQDLSASVEMNAGARTGSYAISRYHGGPDDRSWVTPTKHLITMCSWRPAHFEMSDGRGKRRLYAKQPGALSLVPAGICPALSPCAEYELVVCALDPSLIDEVKAEAQGKEAGDFRLRVNILDRPAQHLLKLLLAAGQADSGQDRVYTDYLAHALASRFLSLIQAIDPKRAAAAPKALPRRALKRVEERMQALDDDLSLQTLAKESGYSKVHFSRMFRAAKGQTPHNYILRLRIERAQQLLATSSDSLTELALKCGFSSHSHMTRVFRQFLSTTPSAYRRER